MIVKEVILYINTILYVDFYILKILLKNIFREHQLPKEPKDERKKLPGRLFHAFLCNCHPGSLLQSHGAVLFLSYTGN